MFRCMLAMLLLAQVLAAQSYTVSSGDMVGSFANLASPNVLPLADNELSAPVSPAGFSFVYFGQTYTSFKVCTNGYVRLDGSGASMIPFPTGAPGLTIAPFWEELKLSLSPSPSGIGWDFSSGVLTIEWKNLVAWVAQSMPCINVQLKIDTATGSIEFRYGNPTAGQVSGARTLNWYAVHIAGPTATSPQEVIYGQDTGYITANGEMTDYPQNRFVRFTPVAQPAPVTIMTAPTLPAGVQDTAYSVQLAATGGVAPYTWLDSSQTMTGLALPAGWDLSPSGLLSAAAADVVAGSFAFDITVQDQSVGGSDTRQFFVTIAPAGGGGGGGPGPGGSMGGLGGGSGGGCAAGAGGLGVLWLLALVAMRRRSIT